MRFSAVLLTSVSMATVSSMAFAQEADDREVIRVLSSPLDTDTDSVTGSVDVLGSDQILRELNGNLADTLERLPGVTSSYFGPASGRPIVRGLGADRVRVLINGLGALDASASSPDHAVLNDIIGAEAIEVLRGPAAIGYGGGAIGGVVNVIDGRIPTELPEDPVSGFVYAGSTSVDDGYQLAGRGTARIGELVLQADYERREADPFDIPGSAESDRLIAFEEAEGEEHEEHEEEDLGYVEGSDFSFESYGGGFSIVSDWGFTGLAVKFSDADYGLPGHAHGEEHGEEEHEEEHHEDEEAARLNMEQTRIDLRGEVRLNSFFDRARWSLAYAEYEHVELEGGEIGTIFDTEGLEGRFELRHQHTDQRQGALGVQFMTRDFAGNGDEAFIEPVTTQDWGAFITERWDFDPWGIEGGLRAETRKLNGLRAERSFDTLSGSLSAFYRPSSDWFASLTVSRTERAPTDVEVFAEGPHLATQAYEIGDLNLSEEIAVSVEGNVRYTSEFGEFELAVFDVSYDGFIELFPTGIEEDGLPVFMYRQEDASLYGFEASYRAGLGQTGNIDWSTEVTLDAVRGELDDGGNLPRIPPLSGTIGLTADSGPLTASAEWQWVTEQDEVTSFELPTDDYSLLNLTLEYRPDFGRDLTLLASVRNVTDEEARLHTSYLKDLVPLPGRNFRLAIASRF